jgi:hypothetical protein
VNKIGLLGHVDINTKSIRDIVGRRGTMQWVEKGSFYASRIRVAKGSKRLELTF